MAALASASSDQSLPNRATSRLTVQPKDLVVPNLDLSFGPTHLLSRASLKFLSSKTYCLHGRNGTGKTTLLRAISERTIPGLPPFMTSVLVRQEILPSELTVREFMLSFDERMEILDERLEAADAADEEAVAGLCDAISNLELEQEDPAGMRGALGLFAAGGLEGKVLSELSGGERKRVALAVAALVRPDVLMLDEPNNHLDQAGIGMLREFLGVSKGRERARGTGAASEASTTNEGCLFGG